MHDVIVVGGGPAGVTAAIYANRSGLDVLLIARDAGSLKKAEKIENYYGFVAPISGSELLENGLNQAKRLGVSLLSAEVTGIQWNDQFEVSTTDAQYKASSVILATGMPRRKATVPGLSDYEGKGVSYCAICDGFFYRNKTVAVIGNGPYALTEACELKNLAQKIYIMTNGRPYEAEVKEPAIIIIKDKIKQISGDGNSVQQMILENGERIPVDGIFIAEGTASALDLALKLGIENDGKAIIAGQHQETNLPGLFAAGDCTGGLLQIAVAVGEGARAGMAASDWIRQEKGEKKQSVQWGVRT